MEKIIIFSCSNNIFIYEKNCRYIPNPPYKSFKTKEDAISHMKTRGVLEPQFVIYESVKN